MMKGYTEYARDRTLTEVMKRVHEHSPSRRDVGWLSLASTTPQIHREQRSLRRFLMLEVSEDIAACGQMFSDACHHLTSFLSRVIGLAEPVVHKGPGDHIRSSTFFGLRHAQCCAVRFQQFPGRVGKPGVVTEFKCRRQGTRQKHEKILEQCG